MLILLLGKNGQIGWELQHTLAKLGSVLAIGRGELDLQNVETIRQYLREKKPHVIVNAAAYTNVDRAEVEPEQAMLMNGKVPEVLAEEAKKLNSILIHYSTDYVFDGQSNNPYTEKDQPSPLNIYGQSKLEGEYAIEATGGAYLILRTGWVYGTRGRNFFLTILRLSHERDQLQVINDQVGTPTWCRSVAEATSSILSQLVFDKNWYEKTESLSGIYHYAASGQTTWYEFAQEILKLNSRSISKKFPKLIPIKTSDYPSSTLRPKYSVLSLDKIRERLGLNSSNWKSQLQHVSKEFISGSPKLN